MMEPMCRPFRERMGSERESPVIRLTSSAAENSGDRHIGVIFQDVRSNKEAGVRGEVQIAGDLIPSPAAYRFAYGDRT